MLDSFKLKAYSRADSSTEFFIAYFTLCALPATSDLWLFCNWLSNNEQI